MGATVESRWRRAEATVIESLDLLRDALDAAPAAGVERVAVLDEGELRVRKGRGDVD